MERKHIEKILMFIEKEPRTEKQIRDFLSKLELSEYGIEKYFTNLFKYDLVTYDENNLLQLRYILWYFPPKTLFALDSQKLKPITMVRKMAGTKTECEQKKTELIQRLKVTNDRFAIL